jgi:hypothetical protein
VIEKRIAGSFMLLGAALEAIGVREGSFSFVRLMMSVSGVGLLATARGASLWKLVLRYLASLFVGVIGVDAIHVDGTLQLHGSLLIMMISRSSALIRGKLVLAEN